MFYNIKCLNGLCSLIFEVSKLRYLNLYDIKGANESCVSIQNG